MLEEFIPWQLRQVTAFVGKRGAGPALDDVLAEVEMTPVKLDLCLVHFKFVVISRTLGW